MVIKNWNDLVLYLETEKLRKKVSRIYLIAIECILVYIHTYIVIWHVNRLCSRNEWRKYIFEIG